MKLWAGRFSKEADKKTNDFNSSIATDSRMYYQDIEGSIAHATMLAAQGIISQDDGALICSELAKIRHEISSGELLIDPNAEDIHTFIEQTLTERIGSAGKRLHTGRSRNDQVALDCRLYLRDEAAELEELLKKLLKTILGMAEENLDTIMPGYTHLQKAQPITFAHHIMAYYEMFSRDLSRLCDWKKRMNIMPLGSGALAGTTYPLDRSFVAAELEFDDITKNSIDGVSDRDFVCEMAFVLSMIMVHLSRFSEEIILWSSNEFGFVDLDDAYSTGSSIMPQKKNPDVAELARGKSGRVFGDLMGLLTMMKGLPLAYNKDMQEDKEQIFDAIDTVKMCLPVFSGMLSTMKLRKENMLHGAKGGFTNATDVADYLVKKGLPFRDAHAVVGRMVAYCLDKNTVIDALTMDEFRSFSDIFEDDVYNAISLEACVNMRKITGGPAKETMAKIISDYKKAMGE